MKTLFIQILKDKALRFLIVFTVVAMCLLTFASQLEIFAIGIITKKGPDFFELFAPTVDGKLVLSGSVTHETFLERWQDLDVTQSGVVTPAEANEFLINHGRNSILDRVIGAVDQVIPLSGNVTNLALFILFVALLKAVTMFLYRFYTKVIAIKISRDLRQEFFEHIQALPMSFYQKYNMGSLSSRVVSDAAAIAEAINAMLTNYLQTPFTVLTTLALCVATSWKLSLFIFVGFPLIVGPIIFIAGRVKRIAKQIQQNQERFASVILDFLGGIMTVKVFAMEPYSLSKYREENDRMAKLERRSARYDLASRPVVHTIAMAFLATALLFGLYLLDMGISEVLVFCGLLYVFYEPFKKFAEENARIQRGVAASERMQEVMREQSPILDSPDAIDIKELNEIVFDDVWFRYEEQWILKGVSFTVKKGETVAIVGPTGAGKSTIVQLLSRLYDVQKGEIRVNGLPLQAYKQKSLRELIAFVPQRPFLFLDTIASNIAFGRGYSQAQIETAARRAHADEFIEELPKKYQTELQDAGKNLSGGQQQRLAIARALVKEAPLLILDEATSALDNVSENRIKQAIMELHGHVTQIIIAHRLSTIEHADKIIYLDRGEKTAEGTRDQLLVSCTGFRHMWELCKL